MPAKSDASESSIQASIIEYLLEEQVHGRVIHFERCNGGRRGKIRIYTVYLPGKPPRSSGISDVCGTLADGRRFALEVKRSGEKPTEEQLDYLEAVRLGGGVGAVVRSVADARMVLFGEFEDGILYGKE